MADPMEQDDPALDKSLVPSLISGDVNMHNDPTSSPNEILIEYRKTEAALGAGGDYFGLVNSARCSAENYSSVNAAIDDADFVDSGIGGFVHRRETSHVVDDTSDDLRGDEGSEEAELDEFTNYNLRPLVRGTNIGLYSTWIDADDTSDYDPSEELKRDRARRRQLRSRYERRQVARRECLESTKPSERDSSVEPVALTVVLRFRKWDRLIQPAKPLPLDATRNGYNLRDRQQNAGELAAAENLAHGASALPSARGCQHCHSLLLHCSILDDETQYPCHACSNDDEECRLIRPPIRKLSCGNCKRKKRPCSYNRTYKHNDKCAECARDDLACVAGPTKDSIRVRIRYPPQDANVQQHLTGLKQRLKARKPAVKRLCSSCQKIPAEFPPPRSGRPVKNSLYCCDEGDGSEAPATGLDSFSQQIDVALHSQWDAETEQAPKNLVDHAIKTTQSNEPPSTSPQLTHVPLPSPPLPTPKRDPESFQITTRLCHPIVFNHDPEEPPQIPCNFCTEPALALTGLPPRKVWVKRNARDTSYVELEGGYHSEGCPSTRVCFECTSARFDILACNSHDLQSISTATDPHDEVALEAAWTRLDLGEGGSDWCSVCPSLATYQCCTVQEYEDATDFTQCTQQGCGLRLCDTCLHELQTQYAGNLQSMLSHISHQPTEARECGTRADCEMLKADGLLAQWIACNE